MSTQDLAFFFQNELAGPSVNKISLPDDRLQVKKQWKQGAEFQKERR